MLTGGLRPARLLLSLILLVPVACGNDEPSTPVAKSTTPPGADEVKAAPRWEHVATFSGTGDQRTEGFEIGAGAIQWRVKVSCTDGVVGVGLEGEPSPLVEVDECPGSAFGFSIRTGPAVLDVDATGRWDAVVDQQVDTPLAEPVLEGMDEGARLAHGDLYDIDQEGSGTATLYELPGGRLALRLDPFIVTRNDDLFVWVSEAEALRTSKEALEAPHVQIDRLRSTAGAQNYELPESVDADKIRSVVIWCEPVRTAYAAATLLP